MIFILSSHQHWQPNDRALFILRFDYRTNTIKNFKLVVENPLFKQSKTCLTRIVSGVTIKCHNTLCYNQALFWYDLKYVGRSVNTKTKNNLSRLYIIHKHTNQGQFQYHILSLTIIKGDTPRISYSSICLRYRNGANPILSILVQNLK